MLSQVHSAAGSVSRADGILSRMELFLRETTGPGRQTTRKSAAWHRQFQDNDITWLAYSLRVLGFFDCNELRRNGDRYRECKVPHVEASGRNG